MRAALQRWRSPLLIACAVFSAPGWSGCEPLDLSLFPALTPDAGVTPPVDVPAQELPSAPPDAGSDAGNTPAPEPEPEPCLPGASACEACVRDAACAAAEVCHPATGECVPSCAGDAAQCPVGLVCSPLAVCVECTSALQCNRDDDASRCDAERGVCVECLTSADCTDDPLERPVCLPGGICGCDSNDDCSGASCELAEGHCEIEDD